MVNEMELLKHFENWYNDNKNEFDDIDDIDIIHKYTEYDYQFDINNNYEEHNHLVKIDISLTQYQYHDSINFMMDEYGMTFNQLKPDNALNYYMNYMIVCDGWFCEKFDKIVSNSDDDDDDDDDDDSSDSD